MLQDVGVKSSGIDEFGAPHFRSELVDLIERAVYRVFAKAAVAEVAQDEFVRLGWRELVMVSVDGAHPQTIALQASDEMPADESSRSAHQCRLHRTALGVWMSCD